MKKKERLPEEEKQTGEISSRDFLVGAGTVVVGGAIGAGVLAVAMVEKAAQDRRGHQDRRETTTVGGSGAITVTKTVGGDVLSPSPPL